MFPDEQRWTGFTMEVKEVVVPNERRWDVTIRRRDQQDKWRTVHVSSWSGVMLDYADTMASECLTAFLYGQRRDLARVAGHVVRLARAHARSHDQSATF